jgi:hypothetical protein
MSWLLLLLWLPVVISSSPAPCVPDPFDTDQILFDAMTSGHYLATTAQPYTEYQISEYLDLIDQFRFSRTTFRTPRIYESEITSLNHQMNEICQKFPEMSKELEKRIAKTKKKLVNPKSSVEGGNLISVIYKNHVISHSLITDTQEYQKQLDKINVSSCAVRNQFKALLLASVKNCFFYIPNSASIEETEKAIDTGLEIYGRNGKSYDEALCYYFFANLIDLQHNAQRAVISLKRIDDMFSSQNHRFAQAVKVLKQVLSQDLELVRVPSINFLVSRSPSYLKWIEEIERSKIDYDYISGLVTNEVPLIVEVTALFAVYEIDERLVALMYKRIKDASWNRLCPAIEKLRAYLKERMITEK